MSDAAHSPDDHGGHAGSPFIQHHYDDAQHQFDSGKFGIWLFLAQEVLFFSALFVAYVLYRFHHPEIYGYAHKYLDVKMGAINTAVLIFSSLTAAWAVRAAQLRQKTLLVACLATTIACALTFLVVKYFEYSHKYHEQILMGPYFDPCVSSGEASLLTKSNACPGHQGSVYWNTEQAQTGCYPDLAIDQNPEKTGVQLQCKVSEDVRMPHLVEKKDDKGVVQKNPDGTPALVVEVDRYGRWVFESKKSTPVLEQCAPAKMHEHHEEGAKPCWRYAPQPAVCRPGFFFTTRCTPGAPCDTLDKHKPFDVSGRYAKKADCEGKVSDLKRDIKKYGEKADADAKEQAKQSGNPVGPITPFGLEISECRNSNSGGFLVEHHDHVVRDPEAAASSPNKLPIYPAKLLAVADCTPPPAPKVAGDVYAEPEGTAPALGAKSIGTAAHELTPEEEHEQLYLGPPPDHTSMFFTIYFAMTGLHGIHVLVGVFVFIWLLIRAVKGHFTPEYFGPVDFAALYWHIVDLIWIFLFPLLYLIH